MKPLWSYPDLTPKFREHDQFERFDQFEEYSEYQEHKEIMFELNKEILSMFGMVSYFFMVPTFYFNKPFGTV